jgi:hypothetical protein
MEWNKTMIVSKRFINYLSLIVWGLGILLPLEALAGYSLTDRDGKVISDAPANAIVTGPTNQIIILNDRGNRKVFEVSWDAEGRALMVKGEKIHLKIYSNGNIEKWTGLENREQPPLILNPVIPIYPPPK